MVPERHRPPPVKPSADPAAGTAWGAVAEDEPQISPAGEKAGHAIVLFVVTPACVHFIAMERGQAPLLPD